MECTAVGLIDGLDDFELRTRRRCGARSGCRCTSRELQNVALPASNGTTDAVAKVLNNNAVVFLHSPCGADVAISHCAPDYIKAILPLIQPQLVIGPVARIGEINRAPFDIENPVGRTATGRGEHTAGSVRESRAPALRVRAQVVPVGENRVVVASPRQRAHIDNVLIGSRKLRITVRRHVDAVKALVVNRVGEWQCNRSYLIIPVVADVRRPWHDAATDLLYDVLGRAGKRWGSNSPYEPEKLVVPVLTWDAGRFAGISDTALPKEAARVLPGCRRVRYHRAVLPEPLPRRFREVLPRLHSDPVRAGPQRDRTCQRDHGIRPVTVWIGEPGRYQRTWQREVILIEENVERRRRATAGAIFTANIYFSNRPTLASGHYKIVSSKSVKLVETWLKILRRGATR